TFLKGGISVIMPSWAVDRQSAYEILAARLARQQEPEQEAPAKRPADRPERSERPAGAHPESVLEEMLASKEFRSLARTAATALGREITRSIFGTARRRR
ncbi:helicase HerA-like domain-containing protein, partial [Microbispora rosea]